MSQVADHQSHSAPEEQEEIPRDLPVDPGCLPAWKTGDLPEPKRFTFRNVLGLVGPGLVLAGGSIGTGEWVMGAQFAAKYHGAFLWAIAASIVCQVILNTEVMRYTLVTGEPIFTGYLRTRPGPKFWLVFYLLVDFGSWWPSQAGLAAQILVVMVQKLGPSDPINQNLVLGVSYGVFMLCAVLALFGGKVYTTLQYVLTGKFLFVLFYLLICCIFFVSMKTWAEMWGSLINPWAKPTDAAGNALAVEYDWFSIAALSGFSGVGGLGNILASNFVRENGWGMGRYVGAIPSAFGGHSIKLSHLGTIARDTPENVRKFKGWFRYLIPDQWVIWCLGSLVAMMLPAMLGAEYLRQQSLTQDWQWAAAMARDFGSALTSRYSPWMGFVFLNLTLICGLVIMIPGQFYTVDVTARRWTDAVWSGVERVRKMGTDKVKYIYYSFAGLYVAFGILAYSFFPNMSATTMLKLAGSMANLGIAACIFHTLYVNHRFLPRSMRPGVVKSCALFVAGSFFSVMFGLVFVFRIWPMIVR